jgi:hypothetical protein
MKTAASEIVCRGGSGLGRRLGGCGEELGRRGVGGSGIRSYGFEGQRKFRVVGDDISMGRIVGQVDRFQDLPSSLALWEEPGEQTSGG